MEVDFAALLDALDHGVVAIDSNDEVVYANAAAVRRAGRELVGARLEQALAGAPRPDPQRVRDAGGQEIRLYTLPSAREATMRRYLRTRLTSLLDVDRVLQTVVATLVAELDAALARVWLYEPVTRSLRLAASAGLSGGAREPADLDTHSYGLAEVARERKPFVRNGLAGDQEFDPEWVAREKIASVAIFPLLVGGELRGMLAYFSRRELSPDAADLLGAFAALLSTSLGDAQLLARAQMARDRAEAAQRRTAFLAEATAVLASAPDMAGALQKVTRAAIPQLGDWCAIDLPQGPTGRAQRVAAAHIDPDLANLPIELQRRYPADPASTAGFPHVLRTGQVEYWPEVPESMLRGAARDEEHLKMMQKLGFFSYICVPLSAGGQVLGAMTFVSAQAERRFAPADLATAEELARRTALALQALSQGRDSATDPARATQTTR